MPEHLSNAEVHFHVLLHPQSWELASAHMCSISVCSAGKQGLHVVTRICVFCAYIANLIYLRLPKKNVYSGNAVNYPSNTWNSLEEVILIFSIIFHLWLRKTKSKKLPLKRFLSAACSSLKLDLELLLVLCENLISHYACWTSSVFVTIRVALVFSVKCKKENLAY